MAYSFEMIEKPKSTSTLNQKQTNENHYNKVKLYSSLRLDQKKSIMDHFKEDLCWEIKKCTRWYLKIVRENKKKKTKNLMHLRS